MNQEREIKILGIDIPTFVAKIEQVGGKKLFDGRIVDRYFDFKDGKLSRSEHVLRIRVLGDEHAEVTMKGPREESRVKSREEHTIAIKVQDVPELLETFDTLGIELQGIQEKDRISYELGLVRIDIDQYPDVPAWAEVEGPSEEAIMDTIEQLGLSQHQTSLLSARDMIGQYRSDGDWKNLRFGN